MAPQDASERWNKNQLTETDDVEPKQKELEGVINPIMMNVQLAGKGEFEAEHKELEGVINPNLSISESIVEQLVDRVVDVPGVSQRRARTIQRVEKTGRVSHVQYNDKVVNVPAVTRRLVPAVQAVQKAVEVAVQTHPAVTLERKSLTFAQFMGRPCDPYVLP